jgi:signal peptidase I
MVMDSPDYGDGAGKTFFKLVLSLAIIVVAFILIQQLVVKPYRIPSDSMYPTLKIGDRIIVNKTAKGDINRGDIFVFAAPQGALIDRCAQAAAGPGQIIPCPRSIGPRSDIAYVKRVVGLPGEKISFNNGKIYINNRPLQEPYSQACVDQAFCSYPGSIVIPKNQYYMLGDNRGFSNDSRVWGPVPRENMIGPAVVGYWPLSRMRQLK